MKKKFKISDMNKPWFYFIDNNQKIKFECDDCIRLEISF